MLSSDVTVVTPTIPGREHFLEEAKACVDAQTTPPAEHIVWLDSVYRGPGASMNQLLERVNTDWFQVLPDDDLLDPDHIESLVYVANQLPEADIVFSWGRIEGDDERHAQQYRGEFDPRLLAERKDSGMRGLYMAKTELWRQHPYPDGPMEDWVFLIEAMKNGAMIAHLPRETWTYRFHGDNVSCVITELIQGKRRENLYHLERFL